MLSVLKSVAGAARGLPGRAAGSFPKVNLVFGRRFSLYAGIAVAVALALGGGVAVALMVGLVGEAAPEPVVAAVPVATPTMTPTPVPTATATPVGYVIEEVEASYASMGEGETVFDFEVMVRSVSGSGLDEILMSVDEGEVESVAMAGELGVGEIESIKFSRALELGRREVLLVAGDASAVVEIEVERYPYVTVTPLPTATLRPTATPRSIAAAKSRAAPTPTEPPPTPTLTPTPVPVVVVVVTATPVADAIATAVALTVTAIPENGEGASVTPGVGGNVDAASSPTAEPVVVEPTPTPEVTPSPTATLTPEPTPTALDEYAEGLEDAFANWLYLVENDPEMASRIGTARWIRDGLDAFESHALEEVINLAAFHRQVARQLVNTGWYRDGITREESRVVGHMRSMMDYYDASEFLSMPFLEDISPADEAALLSLLQMAAHNAEEFAMVMDRPAIRHGIRNDMAPAVAMLAGVARTKPESLPKLLSFGDLDIESRVVELPASGKVWLYIARTKPGAERSMDFLENAVREIELLMGEPLITNYVGVLFDDAVPGEFDGTNFMTHIGIRPEYDVDDDSVYARKASRLISHEVAHYYWNGSAEWLDEGVAELIASVLEYWRTGQSVRVTNDPCVHADDIFDLLRQVEKKGLVAGECYYSLSERLFVDMYWTLGESETIQRLTELYQMGRADDRGGYDRFGRELGIAEVRKAFRPSGESAGVVLRRWYEGTVGYDLSRLDDEPRHRDLEQLDVEIERVFVAERENGQRIRNFSLRDPVERLYLIIEFSFLLDGRHDIDLELSQFYSDGFEFRREPIKLRVRGSGTDEGDRMDGKAWIPVGPSEWKAGTYWVYLYEGTRKMGEARYEVHE